MKIKWRKKAISGLMAGILSLAIIGSGINMLDIIAAPQGTSDDSDITIATEVPDDFQIEIEDEGADVKFKLGTSDADNDAEDVPILGKQGNNNAAHWAFSNLQALRPSSGVIPCLKFKMVGIILLKGQQHLLHVVVLVQVHMVEMLIFIALIQVGMLHRKKIFIS